MRHKTKLISPMRMAQAGIPVYKGVQKAGEIMITWPEAFHSGFNLGFNLAESVNFVPPSLWKFFMEHARTARVCRCRPDSITINMDWLQKAFEHGRPPNADSSSEEEEQEEPPPSIDESMRVVEPSVGQHVLFWVGSEWLKVTVVAVLDDYIKIHETGARSTEDMWVSLDSNELCKYVEEEPSVSPSKKRPASAAAAAATSLGTAKKIARKR